jgi:hypothetical protein
MQSNVPQFLQAPVPAPANSPKHQTYLALAAVTTALGLEVPRAKMRLTDDNLTAVYTVSEDGMDVVVMTIRESSEFENLSQKHKLVYDPSLLAITYANSAFGKRLQAWGHLPNTAIVLDELLASLERIFKLSHEENVVLIVNGLDTPSGFTFYAVDESFFGNYLKFHVALPQTDTEVNG